MPFLASVLVSRAALAKLCKQGITAPESVSPRWILLRVLGAGSVPGLYPCLSMAISSLCLPAVFALCVALCTNVPFSQGRR